MKLPSSGTMFGDTSNMRDPHKLGNVMWDRTHLDNMVPLDLHNRITPQDEKNLDLVYKSLIQHRKVRPALRVIVSRNWFNMILVKPYLIETVKGRSESRSMIAEGDWEPFWSVVN